MELSIFLFLALAFLVLIVLFFYLKKSKKKEIADTLELFKEDISNRLNQAQTNSLNSFNSIFAQLSNLCEKLGSLSQESREIHTITRTFQDTLTPTKRRGALGESLVESFLREVLPAEAVLSQYTFKDGKRVDFVIKLQDSLVPIDAKFSLEVFKNYADATGPEKSQKRRLCVESIKKRILEASQYIYPDEGTLDFALMYVASEAVYYFIITETGLLDFARSKKVFVVGPNTLYIYLKTLSIGFKALKIEKNAQQIYSILGRLEKDFESFSKEYGVLGTHLRSATTKYQELTQKIEKISLQLKTIEESKD